MSYEQADRNFIDYKTYQFGAQQQAFRDRRPLTPAPLAVCLGAAQTFGRYVQVPYPALLEQRFGATVVNFGTGGASPEFFLSDLEVIGVANQARVVVVQVMSARSVSNDYYTVKALRNAWLEELRPKLLDSMSRTAPPFKFAHALLDFLSRNEPDLFAKVVDSMRKHWVSAYRELLARITPPKILFWFSERRPDESTPHNFALISMFPQLVDVAMVESLTPLADKYVACISSAGLPQSLFEDGKPVLFRKNGKPRRNNRYYPSPQMHELAAEALTPAIKELAA